MFREQALPFPLQRLLSLLLTEPLFFPMNQAIILGSMLGASRLALRASGVQEERPAFCFPGQAGCSFVFPLQVITTPPFLSLKFHMALNSCQETSR